jgi:NADH-quinone oxidoreductase subunit N
MFFNNLLPEFFPGSAEIFIGLTVLIFLVLGAFKGDTYTRSIGYLCITTMLLAVLIIAVARTESQVFFNSFFIRNDFTVFCKISILLITSAVLFISLKPLECENMKRFEYPILVLCSSLGMMIMVSSNDLMALYLGLELQSFSLYILVALKRESVIAGEAGIKYFIMGALASVFILYGSSLLYGLTGATEFKILFSTFKESFSTSSPLLFISTFFILAGIAFKLSLVPFHMWAPDVYQGSPTLVTALIATAPKVAAFAVFIKIFCFIGDSLTGIAEQVVIFLAFFSIGLGSLSALFQSNIKRLLSYSAISHMGYALLGILGKSPEGIGSTLIYLIIYMIMTVGIFSCLLNLRKSNHLIENLSDFSSLGQDNPLLAILFAVFLFSLAGIPPFAGFFAKLSVFNIALKEEYYTLVVFSVIMSVVSASYYLKIIKIIYFNSVSNMSTGIKTRFDHYSIRETYIVITLAAFVTLFYVCKPSLLENAAYKASLCLFK